MFLKKLSHLNVWNTGSSNNFCAPMLSFLKTTISSYKEPPSLPLTELYIQLQSTKMPQIAVASSTRNRIPVYDFLSMLQLPQSASVYITGSDLLYLWDIVESSSPLSNGEWVISDLVPIDKYISPPRSYISDTVHQMDSQFE